MRLRCSALVVAVLASGCSCRGSGELDGGADVPVDLPLADAGPWRPAFAPRIIYANPEVTCAPVDLTYSPPPRAPAPPGTVLWVYRPLEDPAALTRLGSVNADPFQFASWPIFGTTDGGLVSTSMGTGTRCIPTPYRSGIPASLNPTPATAPDLGRCGPLPRFDGVPTGARAAASDGEASSAADEAMAIAAIRALEEGFECRH